MEVMTAFLFTHGGGDMESRHHGRRTAFPERNQTAARFERTGLLCDRRTYQLRRPPRRAKMNEQPPTRQHRRDDADEPEPLQLPVDGAIREEVLRTCGTQMTEAL